MSTLPLFPAAAQEPDQSEIDRVISYLSGRGWVKGRDIWEHWPLWTDRQLRAVASASQGRIISGQKGYCLIEEATVEEARHAAAWLRHQAASMTKRAYEIEQAMHTRQGSAA